MGRRNLTDAQGIEVALRFEPVMAAQAKEKQAEFHGNQYTGGLVQKSAQVQSSKEKTRQKVAELAGVPHDKIHRYKKLQKEAPPELLREVGEGKGKTSTAHRGLAAIRRF